MFLRYVLVIVRQELLEHNEDIYSRFSSNSEADASKLLENLEEMFPR